MVNVGGKGRGRNRGNMDLKVRGEVGEVAKGVYPQPVVHIVSANYVITRQSVLCGQRVKFNPIKVGEANIGGNPDESGTVLLNAIDYFRRQPVLNIKMHKLLFTDLAMKKAAIRKKRKKKNTPEQAITFF